MDAENKLFPGRPNYTGPVKGWFGLLHHEILCEESHDVMERVEYIKHEKKVSEVAIRLHNLIYLDPAACPVVAKLAPAWAEYQRAEAPAWAEYQRVKAPAWAAFERVKAPALAEYERVKAHAWAEYERVEAPALAEYERVEAPALAEIFAYIKTQIPDCAWDGTQLVFA